MWIVHTDWLPHPLRCNLEAESLTFVALLVIGSGDHDRFRFAKAAIARRKEFMGRDVEETVVLAVGEGRSNVHVTRKTRRKARPLWKVTK
jgi:hypothetical protein